MRYPVFLVLIILLAAACGHAGTLGIDEVVVKPAVVNPNLIPNFSFEEVGANGLPVGWTWGQGRTEATCTVETKETHSGTRSVYLVNNTMYGPNIFGNLSKSEPIRLTPGKTYTLSCYMKGASDGGNGVYIGSWETNVSLPVSREHWKRVTRTFTPSASESVFYLRIITQSLTPGIYIDDLKLEEGDHATPCMPADNLAHLEPAEYDRTIEGDGPFSLDFTLTLPNSVEDGMVEAALSGTSRAPNQIVKLEAGAYEVSVKGQASEVDAAVRELSVRALDNGRSIAVAKVTARFPSAAGANRRLEAIRAKLPGLKNTLDMLKAKGLDIAYPLITYTVLENSANYVDDDIKNQDLIRALTQLGEMETMAKRLAFQLQEVTKGKRRLPAVPRFVASERPRIDGPSFISQVADSKGKALGTRPVFFIGYGHFDQANADVEKFPSYGVNIIQNYTVPYDVFPKEGEVSTGPVTFETSLLDRAQKAGVAVNILLSPHCPPQWLLDKYPELKKQRIGFIKYCTHAPEGQQMLKDYITQTIAPIKDHPALHSICLSNEPDNLEEPCEYATKEWRAWLQNRHGSIGKLNERWGTSLKSFDEATLPNPFSTIAPYMPDRFSGRFYDYCRFNAEFFAGWHKMLADAVHTVAPNVPVHVKASSGCFLWPDAAHNGVDAGLFSKFSEISGNDSSNFYDRTSGGEFAQAWQQNAMAYDIQRSMKDAPVFNSENHIIVDRDLSPVPTAHVRSVLWQDAIHGESATTIWVWQREHNPRSDFAGSIMTRPLCSEAVGIVCSDLNRAANEVTAIQRIKPQVLILHSLSSLVWDTNSYWSTESALYTALAFTGLKIGFIDERQLEDGLSGFERSGNPQSSNAPVIFVPNAGHISDAARAALMQYKGKILFIGTADPLSKDEYNRPQVWTGSADGPPFDPVNDSWRRLWRSLGSFFNERNIKPLVHVRGVNGEPVWGVEWLSAKTKDGTVVNLCNYRKTPMKVVLSANGKPFVAQDVLTGAKVAGVFTLKPLETRLVVGK